MQIPEVIQIFRRKPSASDVWEMVGVQRAIDASNLPRDLEGILGFAPSVSRPEGGEAAYPFK